MSALPANIVPFGGFHRVALPVDAERLDAKGVLSLASTSSAPNGSRSRRRWGPRAS